MNENQELPPLPEPDYEHPCGATYFTPDQMQAYAKATEAANNNRLAKRIKGTTQPSLAPVKHTNVTVVWPDDVKVTVCPKPVGRFELLQPREGGLRSLPIGKYLEHASGWVKAATGADPCAA